MCVVTCMLVCVQWMPKKKKKWDNGYHTICYRGAKRERRERRRKDEEGSEPQKAR